MAIVPQNPAHEEAAFAGVQIFLALRPARPSALVREPARVHAGPPDGGLREFMPVRSLGGG